MSNALRILIVDDDGGDRVRLRDLLTQVNPDAAVTEAGSIAQALDALSRAWFDCVLSVHEMSDGTAVDLLEAGRSAVWGDTPVVVLTDEADEELGVRLLHAGAQDYLVKEQAGPEALRRSVRYALGRRDGRQRMHRGVERLRRAQKLEAVGRLARGVAHEFNNLLMVVMGLSEMLYHEFDADDERREDIGEILAAGRRGQDLTRQLLAFARTDMSSPMTLDLAELLRDTDRLIGQVVDENVQVEVRIGQGEHFVHGDAGQLRQVIVDLCMSAAEATPEGGTVTVSVESGPPMRNSDVPWVILRINDSGPGMDGATRARLFEPFFTPHGKSSGALGLAPVYGIITQHKGRIEVDSDPGRGTTYSVSLPGAVRPEKPKNLRVRSVARHVERPMVLVVEDDPSVRRVAVRVLREHYDVLEAVDGEDALSRLSAVGGRIDLLVTDCAMPRLRGEELARELRERRPGLPIVLMSGYTQTANMQALLNDPSVAFLRKPFAVDELVDAAAGLLATEETPLTAVA